MSAWKNIVATGMVLFAVGASVAAERKPAVQNRKAIPGKTAPADPASTAAPSDAASAPKALPQAERLVVAEWTLARDEKRKFVGGKVSITNTSAQTLYAVRGTITLGSDAGEPIGAKKVFRFSKILKPKETATREVTLRNAPEFATVCLSVNYQLESPDSGKTGDIPDRISIQNVGKELAEEIDDFTAPVATEYFVAEGLAKPERYAVPAEASGDTGSTAASPDPAVHAEPEKPARTAVKNRKK